MKPFPLISWLFCVRLGRKKEKHSHCTQAYTHIILLGRVTKKTHPNRSTRSNRPEKYSDRPFNIYIIFILNKRKQNDPIYVCAVSSMCCYVHCCRQGLCIHESVYSVYTNAIHIVYYDSHINTPAATTACVRVQKSRWTHHTHSQ